MKGILFKPDMIKAIVEGRKTVTRRLMRPDFRGHFHEGSGLNKGQRFPCLKDGEQIYPRYHPGEVVYIKEAWAVMNLYDGLRPCELGKMTAIWYKDTDVDAPTGCGDDKGIWRTPMCLPSAHARYFLKIVSVRPERLQEITEADAVREGVCALSMMQPARMMYQRLWDEINSQQQWDANPWVWRYEFELIPKRGD